MKRSSQFGLWIMGGVFTAAAIAGVGLRSVAIAPTPSPPSPSPTPTPSPSPSPTPSPSPSPTPKLAPSPQPAPKASNSIWRLFSSEAGGFKVLMPGEVKLSKSGEVTAFRVDRPQEAAIYTVSYVDFSSDPAMEKDGVQEAFAGTIEGITDEGGKVLATKPLKISIYPGQEIQAKLANGMTTRIRVYIVEKRLYLVIATAKSDRNLTKSIEGYLNSFQLLGR